MRRTLRNTTALAVGLSVALPHFAVAQIQDQVRAPLVLAQADTGETASVVVPPEAETSEEAAAAEAPAAEPAASEAEAAESTAEEVPAEPESAAAETTAAEAAAAPAAEAAPEAAPEEAAARAEPAAQAAPETDAAPEAEAASEPEAAPEAAAEAVTQPAPAEAPTPDQLESAPTAEELAGQDAAAQTESAPEADAAVETEAAAAAQATPPATGEAEKPVSAQAATAADAASQPAARTPETAATTEMPSEADLARALAGEEGAATEGGAAPADAATTVTTPAAANATAAAPSAGAAAAPSATAASPADAAAAPVPQDAAGTATNAAPSEAELAEALAGAREVPEAEAQPTDAAREAAAADAAPAAAALADTEAPVATSDTRQVTEETARSATEDFVTDLQGTPRQGDAPASAEATQQGGAAPVVVGADGQPVTAQTTQATDDKDDRSNLEKALRQGVLPALAGLAVGQLLSNNRRVELNTGDRVVVTRPDGSQQIIKDDNALLLRPGSTVQTEEYADGSTRTIVTREDGSQVVTIRDADLRVLRRTLVRPDGTTTALIDETASVAPVDVASLPPPARPITVAPGEQLSEDALREALRRETQVNRTFTLGQIRNIPEVRALVAPVDIQAITFDTGSAAIKSDQAQALSSLGRVIAESVRQNPSEIYLIEGHTDTVGADAMNLALSDRRAESVALALTEFFQVPPENMVVQGYGEQFLKVPQEGDVRANRRVAVRRITDLLARN